MKGMNHMLLELGRCIQCGKLKRGDWDGRCARCFVDNGGMIVDGADFGPAPSPEPPAFERCDDCELGCVDHCRYAFG